MDQNEISALDHLVELHSKGELTDQEFAAEKAKLISATHTTSQPPEPPRKKIGPLKIALALFGLLILISMFTSHSNSGSDQSASNFSSDASSATPTPPEPANSMSESPQDDAPKLELEHWSWEETEGGGYAELTGTVKNITNEKLEDVEAVGLFKDKNGDVIKAEDAVIDYNPILPGQTSPFSVMTTWNPEMQSANVDFKELMGGTIKWQDGQSSSHRRH